MGLGQTEHRGAPGRLRRYPRWRSATSSRWTASGTYNIAVCGDLTGVEQIGQGMTRGRVTVASDVGTAPRGLHERRRDRGGGRRRGWAGLRDVGRPHRRAGRRRAATRARAWAAASSWCSATPASYTGAGMTAGSIVVAGRLGGLPGNRDGRAARSSPSARRPSCRRRSAMPGLDRPAFLGSLLLGLEEEGLVKSPRVPEGEFRRFVGDIDNGGEGEVLVRDQSE